MDPNAALAEMLDISRNGQRQEFITGRDAMRLAELTTELHEWIMRGGFLPAAWVTSLETKDVLDDETDGEHYNRLNGLGGMRHQIPERPQPEDPKWHQEMS